MDKLYAPWRDRYVRQAIKGTFDQQACVFCSLFDDAELDAQRFILWKNQNIAVILNLYPYNGGHVMIIPKSHVSELYELSKFELQEVMLATAQSSKILKQALACEGINIGANIGRIAGAGIPQHVHVHIVPRFAGDTGFFTTIGNTKQISVDLEIIYKKLEPFFDKNLFG
ncbi:HIT domain-containing protein [Candidatus Babeliales bacterium]|nr:HIT domain-containing protein [Candidatus Babeliales bacterium]